MVVLGGLKAHGRAISDFYLLKRSRLDCFIVLAMDFQLPSVC